MATTHFELAPSDWRTASSKLFAEALRKASPPVRDEICRLYGLKVVFDGDGTRIDYDGQRVGFGGFKTVAGPVSFSIQPKVDGLDVQSLFDAIDHYELTDKVVQFDNGRESSVSEQENELSWTYLLSLFQDIADFSAHNFLVFNARTKITLRGGLRGRAIAKSLIMNNVTGRLGIDCEVLDNLKQRQYATLFLETAKQVFRDLKSWHAIIRRSDHATASQMHSITAKFAPFADVPFSLNLVRMLAHPPYSYGVRPLLERCLQYWRWKGIYAAQESGQKGAFWSVSIALNRAFEVYAGHILEQGLPNFTRLGKEKYGYDVFLNSGSSRSQKLQRAIEPDHIYVNKADKAAIVAEVKYSTNYAPREHVAQLISYMQYRKFDDLVPHPRVGLLVYPGSGYIVSEIMGFDNRLFLMIIPVERNFNIKPTDLLHLGPT
jgi:hypothetical protein